MSQQTPTQQHFYLGQKAYDQGRYDEAIANFDKCIHLQPDYADAYYWRGLAFYQSGNNEQAIAYFDKCVQLQPDYADAYYWLGRVFYELDKIDSDSGKYDQADSKYKKAGDNFTQSIELNSTYKADAYYYQGRINDYLGKYDEAIISYEQCIQLQPDYADAYYWYGNVLYSLQRDEEAAEKFAKSIDLNFSDKADAYYWWGNVLYSLQKYEEAAEKFAKSIDLNFSDKADAYYRWGMVLYLSTKYEEAIKKYQLASRNFDSSIKSKSTLNIPNRVGMADIYYFWGDSLFLLKNKDKEASKKFNECLKHDRLYAPAYYRLGNITYSAKQYREAIKKFTKSIDLQPDYPEAYYWLGGSFSWRRKYEEAVQQYEQFIPKYEQFIQKNPEAENIYYIDVHYWLGTAYYSLGKDSKAVEHLNKFINKFQKQEEQVGINQIPDAIQNEYRSSYYWLGLALYIEKQIPEAEKILQEFVRQNLGDFDLTSDSSDPYPYLIASDTYLSLGRAFIDLKEHDQATDYYEKAINSLNKVKLILENTKNIKNFYSEDSLSIESRKRYIEVENKYFTNLIEAKYNQAFILEQQQKYNLALEKYNQVIRLFNIHINNKIIDFLKKDRINFNYCTDSYFHIAIILEKQKLYIEAIKALEQALKQSQKCHDSCAYIHHKLADIYRQQGEYKKSKEKLEQAVTEYENEILPKEKEYQHDSSNIDSSFIADYWHNNLGNIYANFYEFDKAEKFFLKGLDLDPNNKHILISLTDLLINNIPSKPKSKDEIPQYHRYCMRLQTYYEKALKLLINAKNRFEDSSSLIELGNFLLRTKNIAASKDYNKVEKYFLDAIKKIKQEQKSSEAYSIDADVGLGVFYSEQDRLDKAVEHFKNARQHEPGNLNTWSNLAETYQKQNKLDKAEKEFKDILAIDRYHLDSNIGLGQVYLAMGDAGETEMYQKAIDCFNEAKKFLNLNRGSRKLNSLELANLLYLQGYANFQIYQNSSVLQRSDRFLTKSLDNFDNAIKENKSHYFANRAKEKIESNIRASSGSTVKEELASGVLAFLSLIMFVGIQISCFLPQSNNFNQEIKTEIPATVVSSQTAIQETVKSEAKQETNNQRQQSQLNQPKNTEQNLEEDNNPNKTVQTTSTYLQLGSPGHITLTFGLFIFMVIFIYLPRITRLSFGQKGVELEKSPLRQISIGNLGISNLVISRPAEKKLESPSPQFRP